MRFYKNWPKYVQWIIAGVLFIMMFGVLCLGVLMSMSADGLL